MEIDEIIIKTSSQAEKYYSEKKNAYEFRDKHGNRLDVVFECDFFDAGYATIVARNIEAKNIQCVDLICNEVHAKSINVCGGIRASDITLTGALLARNVEAGNIKCYIARITQFLNCYSIKVGCN